MYWSLDSSIPLSSGRRAAAPPVPIDLSQQARRHRRCALAATALAAVAAGAAVPASAGTAVTSPDFFPIGVWSQPSYSFDKWVRRGVNTLMKYESLGGSVSVDSWSNAANSKGLYQIRTARPNPADDMAEQKLLAWMHDDEPDYKKIDPSIVIAQYNAWKAVDPQRPVLVNFSGGNVLNGNTPEADYRRYVLAGDWIGNDIYPVTGWGRPDWIDYSLSPSDRKNPGLAVDRLRQFSAGKMQIAIIETSDQKLPWAPNAGGVNPAQFRGEVWQAIISGAEGIVYFPYRIGNFSYDATTAEVAAEMVTQNARIRSYGAVLNAEPSPMGMRVSAAASMLQAMSRRFGDDEYFFVLNMSPQALNAQSVRLGVETSMPLELLVDGESRTAAYSYGSLVDDFAPYEMHVYRVPVGSMTGNRTVGSLVFNNNITAQLGNPTLALDNFAAAAQVLAEAGSHQVYATLQPSANLDLNSLLGSSIDLAGPIILGDNRTLTKRGVGSARLSGMLVLGFGSTLAVEAGALEIAPWQLWAPSASLVVRGGTANLRLADNPGAGGFRSISVEGSGIVNLTPPIPLAGTRPTAGVETLSMTSGAKLNVGGADLVIGTGSVAQVRALLLSGRNGSGLVTTSVGEMLAYAAGNDPAVAQFNGYFGGYALDSDSVLIKHTIGGDANLDGITNAVDLQKLLDNYRKPGSWTWTGGDFTYDGIVGFGDLGILLANYGGVGYAALAADAEALAMLEAAGIDVVPEPGGLLWLSPAALLLRRRRGRAA